MTQREIKRAIRILRTDFGCHLYVIIFIEYMYDEESFAQVAIYEADDPPTGGYKVDYREVRDSIALSILCSELGEVP